MPNRPVTRATGVVLLLALLSLTILVSHSPAQFLYDEVAYAKYIPLLHQYGLTPTFLNSLTGTAGPLYAFVQIAFEPLTHLQPVAMRFVNVFLLSLVGVALSALLKNWVAGFSVLIVPMTWVLAGMALTEMPAMVFVTLSLYLQLKGLRELKSGHPFQRWFIISAVCLGIAVWGRQPYLLLCGVPVLLAMRDRRLRTSAAIFAAIVLVMAVPMFGIWKGLVPPSNQFVLEGPSAINGVVSFGYMGICFLLLAPRFYGVQLKALLGLLLPVAVGNRLFGDFEIYPFQSVFKRYLPALARPWFGSICGSLVLSFGLLVLVSLLWMAWRERKDLPRLTIYAGLLCVALLPMFDGHQYSSRYTGMTLPFLIPAAHYWRRWTLMTLLTAMLGCAAGFLSLFSYLRP